MEALSVSRVKYLIVSLFLLSLIAWIVEGLIATETVTFSAYSLQGILNLLAISLEYLVFLAFFAIVVGFLIVMILDRRMFINFLKAMISPPEGSSNQNSLTKLITLIIFFSAMLAFIWLLASGELGNLNIPGLGGGQPSGATSPPSLPTGTSVSESPLTPTLLLVGAILVVTVFVGSLLFIQAIREMREEARAVFSPPEEEVLQEQALNVVGEAISAITAHEGDLDFRTAIIKCYQRLCELLAQRNCQIQKHETVQEFRISASKLLKIPNKPISTLTNHFEEARYSMHEIDEAKRNEALKCLEEIRSHLIGDRND